MSEIIPISAASDRVSAASDRPQRLGAVILIPKHLRLDWMDALALDPELSPTAYKVAAVIGFHFNRDSGETFIKQETIAGLMELSERTVWGAIVELERRGYLIVARRALGITTRSDERTGKRTTVRNAGGKGVANTYRPAFQRLQVTATNIGSKLAEFCELTWEQRSQNPVAKVAEFCEPTLKTNPKMTTNVVSAREPKALRNDEVEGTRLPTTWEPTVAMNAFAEGLGLNATETAERFGDYWRAVPGAKGLKCDWSATWRNWCRREADGKPGRKAASAGDDRRPGSVVAAAHAALAAGPLRSAETVDAAQARAVATEIDWRPILQAYVDGGCRQAAWPGPGLRPEHRASRVPIEMLVEFGLSRG